jgi:CheY-like chemotaxis protein
MLEGKAILWIDDNLPEMPTPRRLLRDYGADLSLAFGPNQAINMLAVKDYDLVIMDVLMDWETEPPLTVRSVQKKWGINDLSTPRGLSVALWIHDNKRYIPFFFLTMYPEHLDPYRDILQKMDSRTNWSFMKDKTMSTARFPQFVARIMRDLSHGQ